MNKKSIFITGAGRGIGKATAQLFAKKGWFIGLSDINDVEIKEVAKEIGIENCSLHIVDVRNVEQLQAAIADFGKITADKMNVLFNNAGILFTDGFEKVSLENHKAVVDVNFIGLMNATFIALPLLKATPKSAVINMCSASSFYGNPELTTYAATKSAVKSLTEGWNMLFEKYDIHVADILPAYVSTPMVNNAKDIMELAEKDIKLNANQIAQAVWNAAHSTKMHHLIGTDAKLLKLVKWLLPHALFKAILKKQYYAVALKKN